MSNSAASVRGVEIIAIITKRELSVKRVVRVDGRKNEENDVLCHLLLILPSFVNFLVELSNDDDNVDGDNFWSVLLVGII